MFNLFSKCHLSAFLALVSLCAMNSALTAEEYYYDQYASNSYGGDNSCASNCCDPCAPANRLYIGAFGGELYSNSPRATQMGTALFLEAEGGPLAVQAEGHLNKTSSGFGGAQIGYEWSKPLGSGGWKLASALELEAFWFRQTKKGHLFNTTDTDRLPEHDFLDTFKLNSGVYLANIVFAFDSDCLWGFSPYVGVGAGASRISIKNADSLQVAPLEAGINHFNAKTHDSSWAFAAQVKAGVRYKIFESFHIFAEYRYVYVDFSNYIFGSTVYPTHAHTTPWNVKINDTQYNAFAVGIQFDL